MSEATAILTAAVISSVAPSLVGLIVARVMNQLKQGQDNIHLMLNSQRDLLLDKLAASEERRATAEATLTADAGRTKQAAAKVLETATAAAKVLETATAAAKVLETAKDKIEKEK